MLKYFQHNSRLINIHDFLHIILLLPFPIFLGAVHYRMFSTTWFRVNYTPCQSRLLPHQDLPVVLSRDLFGLVRTRELLYILGSGKKFGRGVAKVFGVGVAKYVGGCRGRHINCSTDPYQIPINTRRKMTSQQSEILHSLVFILSVPSAVLNLSEGTVSETSIAVSWSRNPQSLQDKFQVSTS